MAKKPLLMEKPAVQEAHPTTVFVTYLPDDGDNDVTHVNGVQFQADEPLELDMTKQRESMALLRLQGNPYFHIGDDAPPSRKSKAVAERAKGYLDRLEDILADFRAGKATHYHADELARIAVEIKESTR